MMRTYKIYNDFVDKYMDLKPFVDNFISDNITYYYPDKTVKANEKGIKFKKRVTIQWRQIWPKERKGQLRLLGNAIPLTDKLSQVLPNDILIRLINTASLPYKDQISLMRNTDYLIGNHGAGLSLSIFLPKDAILQEIKKQNYSNVLTIMSALSGHVTYSDLINATVNNKHRNEYIIFDENDFAEKVMKRMKENNFF